MIRTITGMVTDSTEQTLTIAVLGIGFKVFVPQYEISQCAVGEEVTLHTYLALRENAADLYGFLEPQTLTFFELLLGVSGVGPRSALGITSLAAVDTLMHAIQTKDITYLTRVAGVGKKMAEKIVLELKDKVGEVDDAPRFGDDTEILDTLIALGYKEREAKSALQAVPNTITDKDARLRAALKHS